MISPIVLKGKRVLLEPIAATDVEALFSIGREQSLWKWTLNVIQTVEDMRAYVEQALDDQKLKRALPFVVRVVSSGEIIGSTRFGNIDSHHRRVEIGWTWIASKWQQTFVNTEMKFLMLSYAFETWKYIRVEFKTDVLNEKSRNALKRIGAKEEGVFRQHMITDAGRFRDTVYFSILDSEWISVKNNLLEKLGK